MAFPPDNEFGNTNFPNIPDPSYEDNGKRVLYPKNLQDEVNEAYNHDKVLPRIEGVDYEADPTISLPVDGDSNQEESFK